MMKILVRLWLVLLATWAATGCGTIISAVGPDDAKLAPYSGTRLMAQNIHGGVLDVPFSFVADTLLLPLTVPKALVEAAVGPPDATSRAATAPPAVTPDELAHRPPPPFEPPAIYLLPLDDFAFEDAVGLATRLSADLQMPVKATLQMGDLQLQPLPRQIDLVQFSAHEIMQKTRAVAMRLPESSPRTYAVALTWRDINDPRQQLRFLFSQHMPGMRTSVVSGARMHAVAHGPAERQRALERVYKMLKRTVGEYCLGIPRSTDIADVMYSPLMSLDDLDAIPRAFLPNARTLHPSSTCGDAMPWSTESASRFYLR